MILQKAFAEEVPEEKVTQEFVAVLNHQKQISEFYLSRLLEGKWISETKLPVGLYILFQSSLCSSCQYWPIPLYATPPPIALMVWERKK